MKLINPIAVTDSLLTSSTVPETDYAEWAVGTTYGLGDLKILASTHRIYKSLQAANTGHNPTDAASAWWVDVGPTNKYAMFDSVVSTQTTTGTSLTVVLTPGAINSLALINIQAESLTVSMTSLGVTVYSRTMSLVSDIASGDWFGYFFEPYRAKTDVVLTDLPSYTNGVLTVTLTHASAVKVGSLVVGLLADLGSAQYGAKAGIVDYSRKETDTFGNTVLTKRSYSKRMTVNLIFETGDLDGIHQTLALVRSTPVVWIAAETYSSFIIFGFYKDFEVDLATNDYSYCSLQIEGLI